MLKNRRADNRGVALLIAIMTVVILAGIMLLMATRTLNEIKHSADDAAITETLLVARGGGFAAGVALQDTDGIMRTAIENVVAGRPATDKWVFGYDSTYYLANKKQPKPETLETDLGTLATSVQTAVNRRFCNESATTPPTYTTPKSYTTPTTGATFTLRVYVTDTQVCGQNLPSGITLPKGRFIKGKARDNSAEKFVQEYALPFVLVSEAQQGGKYKRNVVVQGEFRFETGTQSFANYLGFYNKFQTQGGGDLWLTSTALFDGPVHTNEYFRFWGDPYFGGKVTSGGCWDAGLTRCNYSWTYPGAVFAPLSSDGGSPRYRHPSQMGDPQQPSYRGTQPAFADGVKWNQDFIEMPVDSEFDKLKTTANDGDCSPPRSDCPKGLTFGGKKRIKLHMGNQDGTPPTWNATHKRWDLATPTSGLPAVKYQYIEVCNDNGNNCKEYRYKKGLLNLLGENEFVLEKRNSGGNWDAEGKFNGLITVDNEVKSLSGPGRTDSNDASTNRPALADFAEITIAAKNQVDITGDLTYETPPCEGKTERNPDRSVTTANCNKLDVENVLGVYSQNGDVLIKNGIKNLTLHGVFMSSESEVLKLEDYSNGTLLGELNLLGGSIGYYAGVQGSFNRSQGLVSGYETTSTYDRRMANGTAPPYFPTTGEATVPNITGITFGQQEQVY